MYDFISLQVRELKILLKENNLKVSGRKAELIARLCTLCAVELTDVPT